MEDKVLQEQAEEQQNATVEEAEAEQKTAPFDYEKLASIISGKQTITEDKVLKGYFEQQGMSADEMKSAIDSFKEQKAKNTPDVGALQSQITEANERALNAEMQSKAMLMATDIGVDIKAMPFIIRMANLHEVATNGQIDESKLRQSLEEVVEAIPTMKSTTQQAGFQPVGADTESNSNLQFEEDQLYKAFGQQKK